MNKPGKILSLLKQHSIKCGKTLAHLQMRNETWGLFLPLMAVGEKKNPLGVDEFFLNANK